VQKFTRPLTREIELGGERIGLTLAEDGIKVRLVGARRPPLEMSWGKVIHYATAGASEPTAAELANAVAAVKKGGPAQAGNPPAAVASPPKQKGGDVSTALQRLETWLRQHRPGMLQALRPGATPAELDALQRQIGMALPASLRDLLAWHNGQKADRLGGFEQDWRLMSTEQIEKARRELRETAGQAGASWLPIFEDGNGDYLFVDTGSTPAPLRTYWVGQAEQPTIAPSLDVWLEDFVSAAEQGQYYEEAERGTFIRKH
jgi:cell wall assembly regulator SMI1